MKLRETESTLKLNVQDAQIKTRFSGNLRKFVGDFIKMQLGVLPAVTQCVVIALLKLSVMEVYLNSGHRNLVEKKNLVCSEAGGARQTNKYETLSKL